ncbi:uncharacterized protein SCHCODRAFT_02642259 [Schizophyllum commune H4-8]|uniref:uncharacterized protein n=1 Tax=Schizophyllum commune (strain H4-8 / FGSC 9210) TaxID=578458 RepID=UPI00215F7351|nr:uncharacterized protein SCHCODRAFT_02642259 [Schizophyllum commune H4-8]KAI5886643.1 hypothetical protein SCHCODRAFT_02642259 [Schizophyllum commune H4-8]
MSVRSRPPSRSYSPSQDRASFAQERASFATDDRASFSPPDRSSFSSQSRPYSPSQPPPYPPPQVRAYSPSPARASSPARSSKGGYSDCKGGYLDFDDESTYAPSTFRGSWHKPSRSVADLDSLIRDEESLASLPNPRLLSREVERIVGDDNAPHTTEIDTIPCAGLRIMHGPLKGLFAWRLVVRVDHSLSTGAGDGLGAGSSNGAGTGFDSNSMTASSRRTSTSTVWSSSSARSRNTVRSSSANTDTPPDAIVANFVLDTASPYTRVSPETLLALGCAGGMRPGQIAAVTVQGVRTACVVGQPGEANSIGAPFIVDGSLTFYFDHRLDAPVLYVDDENRKPDVSGIPRTIARTFHRSIMRVVNHLHMRSMSLSPLRGT